MTKVQLKSKLIEKIESLEDIALIEELIGLVSIETQEVYHLDEKQLKQIEISQKQIEDGEFLTNEEVNKKIDEWLEK